MKFYYYSQCKKRKQATRETLWGGFSERERKNVFLESLHVSVMNKLCRFAGNAAWWFCSERKIVALRQTGVGL